MSQLCDKLRHIYKSTAPAIGFRKPGTETELPPLLLIADLSNAGTKKARGLAGNEIDAAVVSSDGIDANSFKELTSSMSNIPLGLSLEDASHDKTQELMESDWDFVIFGTQTPVAAINKEGLGKILRIEPSLAPGLVRAINELSIAIDAVLIAGDSTAVTVERLLSCQFLANVLNKPLLVNVDSSLTNSELGSLYESGIKGLILSEGTPPKTFAELKKLMSSLPKITKRKTKAGVLLPSLGISETKVEKVEEEEEEEDT